MSELCPPPGFPPGDVKVYFGFPEVLQTQDAVLRRATSFPSLGGVARAIPFRDSQPHQEEHLNPGLICELAGGKAVADETWIELMRSLQADESQFPQAPLEWRAALGAGHARGRNSVLFVGGSYDPRDRFLTAAGPLEGARVHAATFSSTAGPGTWREHARDFALDVFVGAILGWALSRCWAEYERARAAFASGLKQYAQARTVRLPSAALLRAWFGRGLFPALAIALSVLACMALLLFTSGAALAGIWINPAPMVLGVFAESLLANRERPDSHFLSTASPFRTFELGLQALLWSSAIYLIASTQH